MPTLAQAARAVLCAVILAVTAASVAVAQTSAAGTSAIEGNWDGELFFDRGNGPMSVTIAKADSGHTGTVSVTTPSATVTQAMRRLEVGDSTLVFEAPLEGADVTFTGRLEGAELVGTFIAAKDGATVAEGQWSARRKP